MLQKIGFRLAIGFLFPLVLFSTLGLVSQTSTAMETKTKNFLQSYVGLKVVVVSADFLGELKSFEEKSGLCHLVSNDGQKIDCHWSLIMYPVETKKVNTGRLGECQIDFLKKYVNKEFYLDVHPYLLRSVGANGVCLLEWTRYPSAEMSEGRYYLLHWKHIPFVP